MDEVAPPSSPPPRTRFALITLLGEGLDPAFSGGEIFAYGAAEKQKRPVILAPPPLLSAETGRQVPHSDAVPRRCLCQSGKHGTDGINDTGEME